MREAAGTRPTTAPVSVLMLVAVVTLVWGTNWSLFPLVVRELSVWTFRAVALFFCGAVLLGLAKLRGQSLAVPRSSWGVMVGITLIYLVVWNIAITYSAILMPSGQSAVLGFTMPLWAAIIAWLFLGERLSARMVAALLLGVAAVAMVMVPNFAAYAGAPLGFALGLLAAIGWAIGTLMFKRHRWTLPVLVLTGWQMLLTSVPITVGALVLGDAHWFMPSWQTIALVTYITLVPMSIGSVCWFAIVNRLPVNVAGLSPVMVPVVAVISGAIVHGEPLGLLQVAALTCSVASLSLALLAPARRF